MPKRSAARKVVYNKVKKFDDLIRDTYIFNIETYYVPVMINIIMTEYDGELTGRVTDRRSRTNPLFYRDEFEEALMYWDWIQKQDGATVLVVPETETFNWRQGRLRIVEKILEGLIGQHIEVDGEQYIAMYGKPPIIEPFDKTVPRKERIYTLRFSSALKRKWQETFSRRPMVKYPFSNQPPIDIFDSANVYVNENMNDWANEAIREAQKEIGH